MEWYGWVFVAIIVGLLVVLGYIVYQLSHMFDGF